MEDDLIEFRVWPDGTVQETVEPPLTHMSDDYRVVQARDVNHAVELGV